ncbi:Eukaryotic aspartyl protease [Aphelenchoides besseyi]|nr:Eukaryotic aspartyl protease [Aphelenchoides besseyi]
MKLEYGLSDESTRSFVIGYYYKDQFALGDAKIGQSLKLKRRVTFGAAKRTYRTDSPIIGFGITKDRTTGTLIYEQAYKEKLFDRPIFTLYLKNCKNRRPRCMHGGTLTLGAYDKKNCGKVEGWAPSFTYGGPWQFKLSKISVGDYTFRTPTTTASDSGSPMLHLPARVVRRIARELDATYQHNYYMIRCSKRFVVKLTINGKIYKIQKDAITFNMGNGRCLLYISEGDDNFILLGDPFQRAYCHIHDFKNRRIGFALPKKE